MTEKAALRRRCAERLEIYSSVSSQEILSIENIFLTLYLSIENRFCASGLQRLLTTPGKNSQNSVPKYNHYIKISMRILLRIDIKNKQKIKIKNLHESSFENRHTFIFRPAPRLGFRVYGLGFRI